MRRQDFGELTAFVAVARARSFTKAAATLGVSQSALSHTIAGFEERLGVRLLTRTTRSVATTSIGERLLASAGPRLDEVEAELAAVAELRDRPAGTVRINASRHAATRLLWPALLPLLRQHPDIKLEIAADNALTDIVAERFDAGVRLGEHLAKDMVAVRIGPEMRMVVVGAPAYLAMRSTPKAPRDLMGHNCINLRLPTRGGLYAWEFEKNGRAVKVRVEGQLIFNETELIYEAALAGLGLACIPDDLVVGAVTAGKLTRVLDDWSPAFPGYYIYYPSRRQLSPALALVVASLRQYGTRARGARSRTGAE